MTASIAAASSKIRRSDPPAAASISPTGTSPSRWQGSEIAQPSIMLISVQLRSASRLAAVKALSSARSAMRGGETALGVHHPDIEEFRHRNALDQRALPRQRLQRALECPHHRFLQLVERNRGRHRQTHALDRSWLQWLYRLVGEHGVKHRAASDRARQRPKAVERE